MTTSTTNGMTTSTTDGIASATNGIAAATDGIATATDGLTAPAPNLPPGPRMPSALQTAIWVRRAQWLLSQCAARFGDVFRIRIAREGTWIVLSNPDHIKQVFTGDPRVFHAGEGNRILLPILGEHSLLLLDEDAHMEQRKLLLPPLHGQRMQRYRELMSEIAAAEIERWPSGEPYPLRPRMQAITLEIILRAVFGLEQGERLETLRVELRRLLDTLTRPAMFVFPVLLGPERLAHFRPFQRLHDQVDELIYAEITERRRAPDLEQREDILSMLLLARHESPDESAAAQSRGAGGRAQDDPRGAQSSEAGGRARAMRGRRPDGSPMTDREIRDELLTLLVAGHETTATALAWAVERLTRHPDKLARLAEEVHAGEKDYLEAVVTETLRLRPVISLVARYLRQPVEIGGWQLPAGVTVAPSIYLVHRRPDVYPNPERFEPERFIDASPGTYTWIPFGGGIRRCIGGSFAHFEMQVVLAELVRRWQLRPARPEGERVFRRAITETPRHDAEVVLAAERVRRPAAATDTGRRAEAV